MKNIFEFYISHPIQYFSPFFKALAEKVSIKVFYFSKNSINGSLDKGFGTEIKWDTPLLEGYEYSFLPNVVKNRPLDNHFFDVFNPSIIKALWNSHCKIIVVHGWSYSSTILAIIFGKMMGKKIWLRAETPLSHELRLPHAKQKVKKVVLGTILFKFVDRFLYIGKENHALYLYYNVPKDKLIYTPYAVNNDYFKDAWEQHRNNLPYIKERLGLPLDKKVILFSGKFIEKKRPLDIIEAFRCLHTKDAILVMVGEGTLRPQIENYIERHNIKNIYLTGFINQSLIPEYYAVADIFVMCSGLGETWGLAVNEAMNFAKPIIVSSTCGCSLDLVTHEENGFIFQEGDIMALSYYIDYTLQNESFKKKAGKKSQALIKQYSYEVSINNLAEAANKQLA